MQQSSPPPDLSKDLAEALAEAYPPLGRYCPHLRTVSAQQALFLLDDSREAAYGGAAGGGKSDALLMAALQYVDHPKYRALILRRTFPQLRGSDGLIPRAQEWLSGTDATQKDDGKKWVFPSGAELHFGHCESEADRFNYDGLAAQFIGFDELTHFTETQYDWIAFSRARRTREHGSIPIRARGTCTPTGVGYGWVKKRFITHKASDVVFVPARVRDNPGLDVADYAASLSRLPEETRRRLLEGDWEVFEGAAYPDFSESVHVVAGFDVSGFDRFECMDFGVSNPTAWLVVASDYDRNLIVFDELYGPNRDGKGSPVGGLPSETAPLVRERRGREYAPSWARFGEDGWPVQTNRVWADPSIRNSAPIAGRMGNRTSVEQEFADLGIRLTPANNDRQAGYLRLAELIRPDEGRRFPQWHPRAGEYGAPRLYVFSRCVNLIDQLRAAPLEEEGRPLHGEAVDGPWESQHGHAHAALRYGVLSRPQASEKPEERIEDPRRRAAVLIERRLQADLDLDDEPERLADI